jgi:Cu+-exporting ATPase
MKHSLSEGRDASRGVAPADARRPRVDAGPDAPPPDSAPPLAMRILGMTCGRCAARVEEAIRGTDGVLSASVQLLTESGSVTIRTGVDARDSILKAIRDAGYDARFTSAAGATPDSLGLDREDRERFRQHRQALIQALGLALPVVAIDHLLHVLWPDGDASVMSARLLQIVLLVMLAVSPAGAPILAGGLRALRHATGNMDLLISLGVTVAFIASVYGVFVARNDAFVHLHAAAMILAVVCVGRYLEARARGRATSALRALASRAPRTALVRRRGEVVSVPVEQLAIGDIVVVPAHATIPVDGELVEGRGDVDQRLLTGEPLPVPCAVGDAVMSGTIVADGQLIIRATRLGAESTMGRIAALVAGAQASRSEMQRIADRFAARFTLFVVVASAATFAGWRLFGASGQGAAAARAAVAVLVVACPCALGLATPIVVMIASSSAALRGILVRDAASLEALARIDTIVWDKTGTLTSGAPRLESIAASRGLDEATVLRLAASALQRSPHPLARATVARARRDGVSLQEPDRFASMPGEGVVADVGGRSVCVGSLRHMERRGVDPATFESTAAADHATFAFVAIDGSSAGILSYSDVIRPSSAPTIARLASMGLRNEMLTGDREAAARFVATETGIDAFRASASPAEKLERIRELQGTGRHVAMVGDGVNDAAALSAADVGVAFATGADVACESAGINLIGATPQHVVDAVVLARRSISLMKQNLFWAVCYNVVMIPLAAAGALPPAAAAAAMMASSLTVVLNALRLRGDGAPPTGEPVVP